MGGDRPSICWNGDWEPEEISYAKNALSSGRAMKLQVLKEPLPNPEDEELAELPMTTEENEDELLRGSIAMCEDALDDIDEEKKKLINELFNGKANGVLKSKKKSKASTPKKPGRGRPRKDAAVTNEEEDPPPKKKGGKKSKNVEEMNALEANDSFEFAEEEEKVEEDAENAAEHIVAGRIGGKRGSPFGAGPKGGAKKQNTENTNATKQAKTPKEKKTKETKTTKEKKPKENETKESAPAQQLSFTDILPTRNPSRRWGHAFCPLAIGNAIVIGGEGDKRQLSADSIWTLNVNDSTWTAQQSDNTSIPRRVGHR